MIEKTVVTADLGPFVKGQLLEDRAQIAEYFRLMASQNSSTPITPEKLPDDKLLAVIDEVDVSSIADGSDEADEDMEMVRLEALEKALDLVSNEGLETDHAE